MNKLEEKRESTGVSCKNRAGIFVVAVFLAAVSFTATGCTGGSGADITDNIPVPVSAGEKSAANKALENTADVVVEPGSATGVDAVDSGKKQPSDKKKDKAEKGDDVEVVENENEKMVVVAVEDAGRNDPFLPYNESKKSGSKNETIDYEKVKLQYDLVDPPNVARTDADAEKVVTTKVSGIMYDSDSPSAILNIEGSDYLVRSGDVVNGYKVLSIQPTVVTVQFGANVYKAGVGQLLYTDGIQYNTISNLENKFGGAKK